MKKILIILTIVVILLSLNKKTNEQEMIRFRIIANNNSSESQQLKKKVLSNLKNELVKENLTIDDERKYLIEELPRFEEIIKETINNTEYTINYGNNYFPEKEYNGVKYEEGYYESLVITLGEGNGDNFWCILFPPLCVIDEDVEYKSFLKEALSKLFNI